MSIDPGEVTLRFTAALEDLAIPYYVAGSIACIVHGMIRTTMDADIVADIGAEQVAPLAEEEFWGRRHSGWSRGPRSTHRTCCRPRSATSARAISCARISWPSGPKWQQSSVYRSAVTSRKIIVRS